MNAPSVLDDPIFSMPVHPLAAIMFDSLTDDELNELAADIKANGLHHPLVIHDGVLIDGRNRREACKRAGVVPTTEEMPGENIAAFIIGANILRRHMTKGQIAMCTALIYLYAEKGGRGKNSVINNEASAAYLSHARTVVRVRPDLAPAVRDGAMPLDTAYKTAQADIAAADSTKQRVKILRSKNVDLADDYAAGELLLEDAEAIAAQRAETSRELRREIADAVDDIDLALATLQCADNLKILRDRCKKNRGTESELEIKMAIWSAHVADLLQSLQVARGVGDKAAE